MLLVVQLFAIGQLQDVLHDAVSTVENGEDQWIPLLSVYDLGAQIFDAHEVVGGGFVDGRGRPLGLQHEIICVTSVEYVLDRQVLRKERHLLLLLIQ